MARRPRRRRTRHPTSTDRFKWLLIRFEIPGLTAIFAVLLILLGSALGLALWLAGSRSIGLFDAARDQLMALLGLSLAHPAANTGNTAEQAIHVVEGFLSLVVPALYIGAIAFRLFDFQPASFVFRRRISLLAKPETFRPELGDDGYVLAIRAYNSSPMRVMDVNFEVTHQHWMDAGGDQIVRNISVPAANPSWPMADRHVPYTLFVPLAQGDVAMVDGTDRLLAIQGRQLGSRDRVVVHVSGLKSDLGGASVHQRHAYDLPESVADKPYESVHVVYGRDSGSWKGWESFDG